MLACGILDKGQQEDYCRFLLEISKPLLFEGDMDDVSWFDVRLIYVYLRNDNHTGLIQ